MGGISIKAVFVRAVREAGDFVRWPKANAVVTAVIAALGAGVLTYIKSGVWSYSVAGGLVGITTLFAVVLIVKIFAVPLAMAKEESDRHDALGEELGAKIAALEVEVANLKSPPKPPGYANSIYQYGQKVGEAWSPTIHGNFHTFAQISETQNLQNGVFVFKEDLYLIAEVAQTIGMVMTPRGAAQAVLEGVKCLHLGPVSIAR